MRLTPSPSRPADMGSGSPPCTRWGQERNHFVGGAAGEWRATAPLSSPVTGRSEYVGADHACNDAHCSLPAPGPVRCWPGVLCFRACCCPRLRAPRCRCGGRMGTGGEQAVSWCCLV